ncbi:DOMON domain protein [Oesophagostomum dentatum]|uniref:DOMON domain protein n=1 Tax=Oesophagostomum dentatum TaxID=61180 RepID=A0A0B1SNA7_OESDE|nr:DOMON domain protein [Oesophagostomum dentatum]
MLLHLLALVPLLTVNAKSLAADDEKNVECSYKTEDYSLSWKYDEPSSDVVFKIMARSTLKNFWAGFFLGNDDQPRDSLGAFVRNGQIGLLDGYTSGGRVVLDNTTNVQALLFDLQDDVLTAEFARPVSSSDPTDADLTECVVSFYSTSPARISISSLFFAAQMCFVDCSAVS